jgi:hypothetical protein
MQSYLKDRLSIAAFMTGWRHRIRVGPDGRSLADER